MRTTLALFLSTSLPASAADLTLLVDRTERGVEMFVKFETLETEALLAPLPAGFLDAEGLVDIAPFREGTYIYGDELWADIETVIGGEIALVEAMSLMVHPDSLPVDFDDPIDGWIAMAVCNVTDPNARFELGELSTYAGFIAWDVEGRAPLSLTFPREMEVEMTEFLEGREISARTVSVGPDAPLTLDAVTTWERLRFW
ncbi:MAG: hypothetical protein AAFQ54_12545 [Pseudomonadota bacterium]